MADACWVSSYNTQQTQDNDQYDRSGLMLGQIIGLIARTRGSSEFPFISILTTQEYISSYKPWKTNVCFSIWNHHLMS